MNTYILEVQMLNGSLAVVVSCRHLYTCIYRCVLYSCIGIFIHAGARCVSHGDSVGVVQTSVYTGVYILYSCIHIYMHVYTVQLYACTWTYACTMYIYTVYMQVLNGCLAASNRQNWCPAASVYIYMYLQVCTVQLYAHTWMSCSYIVTDRIGVLQRQYTSTCVYRCVLCSYMHTHGLMHVQCTCTLFTYRYSMDVLQLYSNRQNWCPAASVYIYMCLQVCTVQLYAHAWTYACTMYMYIVYMQVLNGYLASSNRQNWCPAASVYIYMYLQVCTVQLYAHTWT